MWPTTTLRSINDALDVFADLRGRQWLCRGQSTKYGTLLPSLTRKWKHPARSRVLAIEQRSIAMFQSAARYFSQAGEAGALADDFVALMVLQHYAVPTRLLDWSLSPLVAAHFAVCDDPHKDGEIWAFDYSLYVSQGAKQWKKWPKTTIDGTGNPGAFQAGLTAFSVQTPPDWFICAFYPEGFPRQRAQHGAFSCTARFGKDHAEAIPRLLGSVGNYHRYIVRSSIKKGIANTLFNDYGIWEGSLFPDTAGVAATIRKTLF